MIEYLIIGFLVGLSAMGIFSKWSYESDIKYKAKMGIDTSGA